MDSRCLRQLAGRCNRAVTGLQIRPDERSVGTTIVSRFTKKMLDNGSQTSRAVFFGVCRMRKSAYAAAIKVINS